MQIKKYVLLLTIAILFSCSADNDVTVPRNLQEYLEVNFNEDLGDVQAFAASASGSQTESYIYYYPIDGATDIRYYEAENTKVDENDLSNYRRKNVSNQSVFGGKLSRFIRSNSEDSWCIVTYVVDGKLHKSNPIQLKIKSKPTVWENKVVVEYPTMITPKFTWSDFSITDNVDYFQVIYDKENEDGNEEFISGTYTKEKTFQFYDTSNVVSDINEGKTPKDLEADKEYFFTMMGVSEDNWVNLIIEKSFVPRNLEEYTTSNTKIATDTITAFAASVTKSKTSSYIYYYPIKNATEIRYYETENTTVDKDDLSNYRRVFLSSEKDYGGKLSRFTRSNSENSWGIVTYLVDGELYTSKPIKIQIATKPTEWVRDNITIDFPETLKPKLTWEDGSVAENTHYLQLFSDAEDTFLSGTFTTTKEFQYYNDANVTSTINTTTPPDLVLNNTYKIAVMGLSDDNWVNLIIQTTFIAQ